MSYIQHPLIKNEAMEARMYQQIILGSAAKANTLVVLPTGLGKTNIAVMLAAHRLTKFPDKKILVMAPTRPLTLQHRKTFSKVMILPTKELQVLTGHVPPEEREKVWRHAKLIFATPQVVEHDLTTRKLNLENFSLLVFDEAHRAVGNYPYGFIAEQYARSAKAPLILALTASPGAEATKVEEVKRNLFVEHVEIRSERDADVKPYVQQIDIEWRRLELPPAFVQVKRLLEEQLKEQLFELKKLGFIASVQDVTKRDLLRVQQEILKSMHELEPNPPENFYMGLMAQASAFRLCHAIEVLETQGLDFLAHYLSQLTKKAKMPGSTKAIKLLAKDSRIEQIISIAERLRGRIEHPKISEALQIVKKQFSENPNSRVIIFSHYRESADQIVKELNKLDNVLAVKFIGQASREDERGLSQKEQGRILDKFRSGEINVLVSTSVGEEGLDIPSVDLVIFYEAVPSEIRFIQRRGRTGRVKPGRVIALLAKGTRDEAFYWSAVKKERRMREMLRGQQEEEKGDGRTKSHRGIHRRKGQGDRGPPRDAIRSRAGADEARGRSRGSAVGRRGLYPERPSRRGAEISKRFFAINRGQATDGAGAATRGDIRAANVDLGGRRAVLAEGNTSERHPRRAFGARHRLRHTNPADPRRKGDRRDACDRGEAGTT